MPEILYILTYASFGMNCAINIMLFISSLLSPGEAGLAYVRPAFLFQGPAHLQIQVSG
jgi:hypothetical protein